jgi:lipase
VAVQAASWSAGSRLPASLDVEDPFDAHEAVAVTGGVLTVARAGPPPQVAAAVVLAVHGLTASHMSWRAVARELHADGDICLLAPDLRGRGRSAVLPGPYGMASHVADLLAVLDGAGAPHAVVAGHSMGAHLAACMAADHPDRVASLVLLDGGVAVPSISSQWGDDEALEASTAGIVDRLEVPVATADDYVARWRSHPAVRLAWNDDIEAYVRYEMTDDGSSAHCVISQQAVLVDSFELLLDGSDPAPAVLARVRAPVRLLHASRGLLDDEHPVIPLASLDALLAACPQTRVECVADVNHYTLLLGDGPGPARAAAAIRASVQELPHAS